MSDGGQYSEEDVVKSIRLGHLLLPESQRLREQAYTAQQLQAQQGQFLRFAHYTTADAALKILQTKRMWMRSTTCMADYREVQHGFDLLSSFFHTTGKRDEFYSTFDLVHQGVAKDAVDTFDNWWKAFLPYNMFVTSVSEHLPHEDQHGRLSMWRGGFGSVAVPRVAIVIRVPFFTGAINHLGIQFGPVSYLTEPQVRNQFELIMSNVRNNTDFLKTLSRDELSGHVFNILYNAACCLKHEGFVEEREWRAFYHPKLYGGSKVLESAVETISGVPQDIQKIPLDDRVSAEIADLDLAMMIDRIIIGPSNYPWVMSQVFYDMLGEMGVDPRDRVVISGIPIRSQ